MWGPDGIKGDCSAFKKRKVAHVENGHEIRLVIFRRAKRVGTSIIIQ